MKYLFNNFFKSKRFLIIKKSLLYSFILKIISLFLFFSTPKLILLNTDSNTYGLFILIISLGAIFSLLDIGVGNSLRNKIAKLNSLSKKTYHTFCYKLLFFYYYNLFNLFDLFNYILEKFKMGLFYI